MRASIIRFASVASLTFFAFTVSAQECECLSDFDFTKEYYELNHPGFQVSIKPDAKAFKEYLTEVKSLRKEITKTKPKENCVFFLERYLLLLRDNHISVAPDMSYLRTVDKNSPEAVENFMKTEVYKKHEVVRYDSAALVAKLEKLPQESIEGIYYSGKIPVAIFKNKTKQRDYAGVLLVPANKLWQPDRIRIEMKHVKEDLYEMTYYTPSYSKIYSIVSVKNGQIPEFGLKKAAKIKTTIDNSIPYEFKSLSGTTNYLRISSFDGSLYKQLDSLYQANDSALRSKPNLIIDIRGNGGGSESCYSGLIKYIYTRPIESAEPEFWVSEDNIKRYEEFLANMEAKADQFGEDPILDVKEKLARLKAAKPGTFIKGSDRVPEPYTLDSIATYPAKIVIIQDRWSASSAEGFIFTASQSDKVVTIGENTGGFVGFGNIMYTTSPKGCYTLGCTTTKYGNRHQYEFTGIPPQHYVPANEDWITYALKLSRQPQ